VDTQPAEHSVSAGTVSSSSIYVTVRYEIPINNKFLDSMDSIIESLQFSEFSHEIVEVKGSTNDSELA
jgi:hypothetical protein